MTPIESHFCQSLLPVINGNFITFCRVVSIVLGIVLQRAALGLLVSPWQSILTIILNVLLKKQYVYLPAAQFHWSFRA